MKRLFFWVYRVYRGTQGPISNTKDLNDTKQNYNEPKQNKTKPISAKQETNPSLYALEQCMHCGLVWFWCVSIAFHFLRFLSWMYLSCFVHIYPSLYKVVFAHWIQKRWPDWLSFIQSGCQWTVLGIVNLISWLTPNSLSLTDWAFFFYLNGNCLRSSYAFLILLWMSWMSRVVVLVFCLHANNSIYREEYVELWNLWTVQDTTEKTQREEKAATKKPL